MNFSPFFSTGAPSISFGLIGGAAKVFFEKICAIKICERVQKGAQSGVPPGKVQRQCKLYGMLEILFNSCSYYPFPKEEAWPLPFRWTGIEDYVSNRCAVNIPVFQNCADRRFSRNSV